VLRIGATVPRRKNPKRNNMLIREIICEGEVIQGNFPSSQNNDKFEIHAFTPVGSAKPESWVDDNIKDKYELSKKISELMGPPYNFKAENLKVMMNNTFIAMPEFGITNEGIDENFGRDEEWYNKQKGKREGNVVMALGAGQFDPEERYIIHGHFSTITGSVPKGIPSDQGIFSKGVKGKDVADVIKDVRYDYNYIVLNPASAYNKELMKLAGRPEDEEGIDENLRAWFGKGKKGGAGGGGWDRYNTKGERIGKCGDSKKGEGKPKCLSKSRAASLRAKGGKKAIGAAVSKKRRNDPNKNRKGKAKNVSNTTRKSKK